MIDNIIGLTYTPAVDICTMIICLLLCCMLMCSYSPKSRNLVVFIHSIVCLFIASGCRIAANVIFSRLSYKNIWELYLFRDLSYALFVVELVFICTYLRNMISVDEKSKKRYTFFIWGVCVLTVLFDCTGPLTKTGFYITENLQVHQSSILDYFKIGYFVFIVTIVVVLIIHRKKFIQKMFWSFWVILFFVSAVYLMQRLSNSTSYTSMTYLFPILSVMFIFHFNSYDTKTGMLEAKTFGAYLRELENRRYMLIFLYVNDSGSGIFDNLPDEYYNFDKRYLVDSVVFRLRDDRVCLVFEIDKNPDYKDKIRKMVKRLKQQYNKYRIDFKTVIMESDSRISPGNEYLKYAMFLEKSFPMNVVYRVQEGDLERFKKNQYILSQLKDIYDKKDMNDPRVLVYAQPVYNVNTKTFDSAEALMRLDLKEIGIVQPEQFISLAEKNQYIHTLSLIILNKTCKQLKKLLEEGYHIDRISVNVAIEEFVLEGFSDEVTMIIRTNGLEYENIALEITESQKENNFNHIKAVISKLHEKGIKFYLDDFGTSYSNLERILGLPVDIVKFDKTMLKLATKNEKSKTFARTMSEMFRRFNYSVLFEGVETDEDEKECIGMYSQYLQGFKYSKPVPIENLREFLDKNKQNQMDERVQTRSE